MISDTLRMGLIRPRRANARLAMIGSLACTWWACGSAALADTPLGADTGIRWDLTPSELTEACRSALAGARASIKEIDARASGSVPFADGLGAVEKVEADLGEALSAPTNLSQFAVSKEVRDASTACSDDYAALGVELAADPAIYLLAQSAAAQATMPEDQQLAKIYIESGRRAAAGLDPATRAEITKLFDELNSLQITFERDIAEDRTEIELNAKEEASLTPALTSTLKAGEHGKRLAVNEATVGPFMENQSSPSARRRFASAYARRGGATNVERLAKAVALRQQLARLLGFPSWATYQTDVKMAKTPERAGTLVVQVDQTLLPKARAEIKTLAALKGASGDATPFARWDYAYYEHQLEKTRYAVDNELIRQYFPVDKVVPSVLDIYARLLGVRFEPVAPAMAWAPGVSEYAIYDASGGEGIGWFFLDLYPREGKYGHFASFPLRAGRVLADGSHRKPVVAIVGNWPTPQPGKPTLLSHREVIVFFHEFGHAMHATLSKTHYATLAGTNVRQDFVEAPSQMLENWMWQPEILRKVSSHIGSGEPLPEELIHKMLAAKHVADGITWTTQAFYAYYDLQLNSVSGTVDPTALWFALRRKMTPLQEIPSTYPEASFGHLMGGYDAGYYGYLWSKVYAQDMFSKFMQEGLDNPAIGMRYRSEILVPGGAAEPDLLVERFLGRKLSFKPFYEELGISGR